MYYFCIIYNILLLTQNSVIKVYFRNNIILLLLLIEYFRNLTGYSDDRSIGRKISRERKICPQYRAITNISNKILNNQLMANIAGITVALRSVVC